MELPEYRDLRFIEATSAVNELVAKYDPDIVMMSDCSMHTRLNKVVKLADGKLYGFELTHAFQTSLWGSCFGAEKVYQIPNQRRIVDHVITDNLECIYMVEVPISVPEHDSLSRQGDLTSYHGEAIDALVEAVAKVEELLDPTQRAIVKDYFTVRCVSVIRDDYEQPDLARMIGDYLDNLDIKYFGAVIMDDVDYRIIDGEVVLSELDDIGLGLKAHCRKLKQPVSDALHPGLNAKTLRYHELLAFVSTGHAPAAVVSHHTLLPANNLN